MKNEKSTVTTGMTKNKKKQLYAAWLAENRATLNDTYAEAVKKATKSYGISQSGYGRNGERIAGAGLLDSGYASLLAQNAARLLSQEVDKAKKTRTDAAQKGYTKYIESYGDEQATKKKECLSRLLAGKMADYSKAYEFAIAYGLNETDAASTAKEAVALSENKINEQNQNLRISVLQKIVNYGLTKEYGLLYAKSAGLSEQDAEEIATVAEQIYYAKKTGKNAASFEQYYKELMEKLQQ